NSSFHKAGYVPTSYHYKRICASFSASCGRDQTGIVLAAPLVSLLHLRVSLSQRCATGGMVPPSTQRGRERRNIAFTTRNTPAAFSALPTVPIHDQKSPAQPSPVPPDQAACSCWRESRRRPGCSHRPLGHEQSPRGRLQRQSSGEPHPFSAAAPAPIGDREHAHWSRSTLIPVAVPCRRPLAVSAPSADPTADVWLQSGRSPAHVHGGRAVRDISPL